MSTPDTAAAKLREKIAAEIEAAGIYPYANSAYEHALNAQTRYLAKIVREGGAVAESVQGSAAPRWERILLRITFWARMVTVVMVALILVTMLVHVLTGHHDPILDAVIGHG